MTPTIDPQQSSLRLYGGPGTRGTIVRWYLEELNIPYEVVALDLKAEEHLKPDYLAINPFGKVPGIEDGTVKLWESGAILLYLADRYDPRVDSLESRAVMNQWVVFANATLGVGLFLPDRRETEAPRLLQPLDAIFEKQPFLLDSGFSAADVAVGAYLFYTQVMFSFDLSPYPAVKAYLTRLSERPAFQKTLGQR